MLTTTFHATAVAAAIALAAAPAAAQKTTEIHPGKGGSPHVRTAWVVDGANISIEYGRPSLKGRPDSEVMPAGQVWRTGADEATTLRTDRTLVFGTLTLEPGAYTLWTIPGDKQWELVINRQTGQWGTAYQQKEDLGRVPMKLEKAATPVEQLTIAIDDTPAGATLRIEWGSSRASVPFTVR
jgi:hypothetical protein